MDNKELLRGMIDAFISEDENTSKELFSKYSTQKTKSLLEASSAKKEKKEKKEEEDESCATDEDVAKDVIEKSNKDD